MKKNLILACFSLLMAANCFAQYRPLADLHVDGKHLKDDKGHIVVLHGVMDTPSQYFNNQRWTSYWAPYDDNIVEPCLNYFNKIYSAITDNTQGAYCDVFRLHLDPCWTNTPGVHVNGEADISGFSEERFLHFLDKLYVPLIKNGNKHGLYVVVRPPGVCPQSIQIDGEYQKYLLNVWDKFTKNEYVLANSGKVGIELANEPVSIVDKDGLQSGKNLHDFFQPIVDKIRENGFKGIIWVPGTGWQANYEGYAVHPITDKLKNIGYAVHDYVGWYGSDDKNPNPEGVIEQFKKQVPIVETNPIMITEVDWSPQVANFDENDPSTYHVNEHNEKVPNNLGTWATGTTSKWGNAYKKLIDHYGNISMTLSGSGCYFDIDKYLQDGTVEPAFSHVAGGDEACGVTCMKWYKEYAEDNLKRQNDTNTNADDRIMTAVKADVNSCDIIRSNCQRIHITATTKSGKQTDITNECEISSSNPNIVDYNGYGLLALYDGECNVTYKYTDASNKDFKIDIPCSVTTFPLKSSMLDPNIIGNGSFNESTGELITAQYGLGGWRYATGLDISDYNYLTVELKEPNTSWGFSFHLFDSDNCWGPSYTQEFNGATSVKIDLHKMYTTQKVNQDGKEIEKTIKINPANIGIAAFWTVGNSPVYIQGLYLSKDGTTAIAKLDDKGIHEIANIKYYSLDGKLIDANYQGIKIKRITYKDGKTENYKCR